MTRPAIEEIDTGHRSADQHGYGFLLGNVAIDCAVCSLIAYIYEVERERDARIDQDTYQADLTRAYAAKWTACHGSGQEGAKP